MPKKAKGQLLMDMYREIVDHYITSPHEEDVIVGTIDNTEENVYEYVPPERSTKNNIV